MTAKEFYEELLGSLGEIKDIAIKKYKLKYSKGKYDFLRIASKEISPKDKVILIRAGIHGNEIAGPLTVLSCCNEIIDYIHQAGLKCIIYPLGNPSGFEAGKRYCYKGREGNNDFLRYECEKWYWSSDPKIKARLPQETRLMHKLLKKDPLPQIAAVIDLHQDYLTPYLPAAAYHYAFGKLCRYEHIAREISKLLPIMRYREIGAGESFPMKTDVMGFIVRHDGTLPDLLFRLGVEHCITVETSGVTPLEIAKKVNLIWIFGIADLIKSE